MFTMLTRALPLEMDILFFLRKLNQRQMNLWIIFYDALGENELESTDWSTLYRPHQNQNEKNA